MTIRPSSLGWCLAAATLMTAAQATMGAAQPAGAAFETLSYGDSGGFAGGGTGKSLNLRADGRLETLARGGPRVLTQLQPQDLATLRSVIAAVDWAHVAASYRVPGAADLVIRDLTIVVRGTTYRIHADALAKLPPALQAVFDRLDECYRRSMKSSK